MEEKIKRNLMILAGATFFILVVITTLWFFLLVRPQKETMTATQSKYDSRKQLADNLGSALQAQRKSEDELNYVKQQVKFLTGTSERKGRFRSLYFGKINGSDGAAKAARLVTWHRWLNEYYKGFGTALSDQLRRIADKTGVTLKTDSKIKVNAPPKNPENVEPPKHGFMMPLSNSNGGAIKVSVTGDLTHILKFFNGVNQSTILMVIGTVKLEGYSPQITASFPVTPYLLASGPGAQMQAPAPQTNDDSGPGGGGTDAGPAPSPVAP